MFISIDEIMRAFQPKHVDPPKTANTRLLDAIAAAVHEAKSAGVHPRDVAHMLEDAARLQQVQLAVNTPIY